MAGDLLTSGKYDIKGYADDGNLTVIDTVDFNFNQKIVPSTTWDQAGATIYDDIRSASEKIQEASGMVPTVMIVGKNIAGYMLSNDQIMKWMGIPSTNQFFLCLASSLELRLHKFPLLAGSPRLTWKSTRTRNLIWTMTGN